MQQIYRRTPMTKCDFNKIETQLYWYHISASVFCCKFAAYFQSTFYNRVIILNFSKPSFTKLKFSIKTPCFTKNTSGRLLLEVNWKFRIHLECYHNFLCTPNSCHVSMREKNVLKIFNSLMKSWNILAQ